MTKSRLPADKKRKLVTRAEDTTNPAYGRVPQERTIPELFRDGIINLDSLFLRGLWPFTSPEKPPGPTSHEVVSWVKRILHLDRAGHAGTLDPQVTGVLPVMLGNSTKIANALLTSGKEYVCIMRLHQKESPNKIREVAAEFVGTIYQRPPLRSSVKRRIRTRQIYYINIIEIKEKNVLFCVGCQAGTYIRKLVYDMGEVFGGGAHMAELRRTRTGPFKEDTTLATLYDVVDAYHFWQEEKNEQPLRRIIHPLEDGVAHLPQIIIRDTAVDALCHGANLAVAGVLQIHADIKPGDTVAILTIKGELVALAIAQQSTEQILKATSGIVAKTIRVVIPAGTYPPTWKRKS